MEIGLELIEAKLRTVQLAVEILTGVCATLPEPKVPDTVDEGIDDLDVEEASDDGKGYCICYMSLH
jgi:hypothetical protein